MSQNTLRFLYFVTPISGYLKNYIKYKQVNVVTFSRTPLVYITIDRFLSYCKLQNIVLWTIILERWFFFYFKMIRAYIQDHYHKRKQKYKQKHGLVYSDSEESLKAIKDTKDTDN